MGADLFPTKTRIALLRAVDAEGPGVWAYMNQDWTRIAGRTTKVTARVDEAVRAGWLRLDTTVKPNQWRLTEAGRAILEAQS